MNTDSMNKQDGAESVKNELSKEELQCLSEFCYLRGSEKSPLRRVAPKIKRNDKCPLDNTKKFKKCCGKEGINHCSKLLLNYLESINNN